MRSTPIIVLAAIAGCHWVLPHRAAPATPDAPRVDRTAGDRGLELTRPDASPDHGTVDQPPAWRDLAIAPADKALPPDKARPPDKAALPDTKVVKPLDAKPAPDSKPPDSKPPDSKPSADGGACSAWSGWSCPSFASFYCNSSCGGLQITCSATSCKCFSGYWRTCTNLPAGFCLGCRQALESGCCDGP